MRSDHTAVDDVSNRCNATREASVILEQLCLHVTQATSNRWHASGTTSCQELRYALKQAWPGALEALGGKETHADVLGECLDVAKTSACLILSAATEQSAEDRDDGAQPSPRDSDGISCPPLQSEIVRAAQLALGPPGVACSRHLSARADWALTWVSIQQTALEALRLIHGPIELKLLPLWEGLKGIPGIHSPFPDVRLATIRLLKDSVLFQQGSGSGLRGIRPPTHAKTCAQDAGLQPRHQSERSWVSEEAAAGDGIVAGSSNTPGNATSYNRWTALKGQSVVQQPQLGADVSAWVVCRELACGVAVQDTDPWVAAAALEAAAAVLQLCGGVCSDRDWRRLAEGVLLAPISRAAPQVWEATLGFARSHGSQAGWQRAVRQLRDQLQAAACVEEGPLAVYGAVNTCRWVAAASALEAALGWPMGMLRSQTKGHQVAGVGNDGSDGAHHALTDATDMLMTLGVVLSDAVRYADGAGDAARSGASAAPSVFYITPSETLRRLVIGEFVRAVSDKPGSSPADDAAQPSQGRTVALGSLVGVREALVVLPHNPPAFGLRGASGAGHDEETDGSVGNADLDGLNADDLLAAAASAQAAARNLGVMLGAPSGLDVLEALVDKAHTAPLLPPSPHDTGTSSYAAKGPVLATRGSLLILAGEVAAGAAAALRAATAASSCSSSTTGAVDTVEALECASRVVRLMRRVAGLLQDPDKDIFSEVGGTPGEPAGPAAAAARGHHLAVAAGAELLRRLLVALPAPLVVMPPDSSAGGAQDGSVVAAEEGVEMEGPHRDPRAASRAGAGEGRQRRFQVVIEELPNEPTPSREQLATSTWRRDQSTLVRELLLLIATYAPVAALHTNHHGDKDIGDHPDGAKTTLLGTGNGFGRPEVVSAAGGSQPSTTPATQETAKAPTATAAAAAASDPALPPPPRDVFTPWADAATSAPSLTALFGALCRCAVARPLPSRALRNTAVSGGGGGGLLTLLTSEQLAEQDLVAACLPELVYDNIRPIVVQKHVQKLEDGPIRPYTGPDTLTRAVAARRLAWLLMRSLHPFARETLRTALPVLLAACDDPAAGVAQYGVAALHAAAVECLAADLQWQRELLLDQARRLVVGCQEALWPLSCPAAVALVRRIEGKDPRAYGYHRLATDLLTEVERQAHVPARRLVAIPAWSHLVMALGLTSLRHTGRLMPLVLEWLHAYDMPTRVGALGLLAAVVRATWPRVYAHAGVLWHHMLVVLQRAGGEGGGEGGKGVRGEGEEERGGALHVCALLMAAARDQVAAFQPGEVGLPAAAVCWHEKLLAEGCAA